MPTSLTWLSSTDIHLSSGGLLGWYYFSDCILHRSDAFWVEITD